MTASISSAIIACLKSFNDFIQEIRLLQNANVAGLDIGTWEDELGRLRIWAANIGAHQTGQSSLDFRLRDASHVREQIVKLLQGLLRKLQDARDVLAEDEESEDEGDADDFMDEEDPKTEIQELQASLATTLDCLFQMSMLVRKPAQHDVHLGSKRADVAAFEPFDYNHVREKYPRADDTLVKRLGKAITRRRKYLRYRERHAIKLRQGIDNFDPGAREFQGVYEGETRKEGTTSFMSDTVATDFQHPNIDFDDNTSETGISQTSYAPTLLSGGNIAIPPPPKTSLGGNPFECPYCFYLVTVHGTRSWNKHVFQDLQPYICIAPTCATPDKLYTTRHEWIHHSDMVHRAATMDDGTPKEDQGFAACPLCIEEIEPGKQYHRHLARHLQELALFILPGGEENSDVSEDQDAESSSSAESVDLAASHDRSESPDGLPDSPVEHPAAIEKFLSPFSMQELNEKEENFRMQITESRRLLGEDHPETLTSMHNLAWIYQGQGRWEEAEGFETRVLETRERILGKEHPDTLNSMSNLALTYQQQGKLAQAEDLETRVLETRERILGVDHPDTLISMSHLASTYQRQGKLAQAEDFETRVLETRERILEVDHPDTLNSMSSLAWAYQRQGKLVQAEKLYEQALTKGEKVLGPNHRFTLNISHSLGSLYHRQGKLAEAEKMYQRALEGREKIFGRDHVDTLDTVNSLCSLYANHPHKFAQAFITGQASRGGEDESMATGHERSC